MRAACDEAHVRAGTRQPGSHISADCAGAVYTNFHFSLHDFMSRYLTYYMLYFRYPGALAGIRTRWKRCDAVATEAAAGKTTSARGATSAGCTPDAHECEIGATWRNT
jgi:hypothetical protein